jgi:hypothetical protein
MSRMPEDTLHRHTNRNRKMTTQQAQDLIDLLRKTAALGLTFDCGTAYIRRSYIDEQTALRARITDAIAMLETVGVDQSAVQQ